jgi:hypothetical protein
MYEMKIKELLDAGYIEIRDHDPFDYLPIKKGIVASSSKVPKLSGEGVKGQILQLDDMAPLYLESKRNARKILGVTKLYQTTKDYTKKHEKALCDFLLQKMTTEYPSKFRLTKESDDVWMLSTWTGDAIEWHPETLKLYNPRYHSLTDALCCQIQEDVMMMTSVNGVVVATMIHLHNVNGWAANTHIGKSFEEIHADVRNRDEKLVVKRPNDFGNVFCSVAESFERIGAISFRGAGILCRHPEDIALAETLDRFDIHEPRAIMRFERQTVTGIPSHNSFVFTIKTYMADVFKPERREQMRQAFSNIDENAYSRWYLDENAEAIKGLLGLCTEKDIDQFLIDNSSLMDKLD